MSCATPTQRIAVLSDIHANVHALRAALRSARQTGFDRLVVLGDLLGYGCHPREVLELITDAVHRDRAELLMGNHDQILIDIQRGVNSYCPGRPSWLRESVEWTAHLIDDCDLRSAFDWLANRHINNLVFAHANPFAAGDWTYLTTPSAFVRAGRQLAAMNCRAGFFGHTHRRLVVTVAGDGTPSRNRINCSQTCCRAATLVTVSAVGQPRDGTAGSGWLQIDAAGDQLHLAFHDVLYDVQAHTDAIRESTMTAATRGKLLSYFGSRRASQPFGKQCLKLNPRVYGRDE